MALSREQLAALFDLKAGVREKTLWKMLYETCGRAQEILTLDIADLPPTDKRGRGLSTGGTTRLGALAIGHGSTPAPSPQRAVRRSMALMS
jgi:integrase